MHAGAHTHKRIRTRAHAHVHILAVEAFSEHKNTWVHTHAHTHTHTHACAHTHRHRHRHTHRRGVFYIQAHVFLLPAGLGVCMYVCACVCVCERVCVSKRMNMYQSHWLGARTILAKKKNEPSRTRRDRWSWVICPVVLRNWHNVPSATAAPEDVCVFVHVCNTYTFCLWLICDCTYMCAHTHKGTHT